MTAGEIGRRADEPAAIDNYARYAVYLVPDGALGRFGAGWLGWDVERGQAEPHLTIAGLPRPLPLLTAEPRRYGFHATIKPPFRLADGTTADALARAVATLATQIAPVICVTVTLTELDGFLALTPFGDVAALNDMAATVVTALDAFRAPSTPEELARRRAAGLTAAQDAHLVRFGYPYVMDQFRAHFTLTGRISDADADILRTILAPYLAPILPRPYVVDSLCLVGEQATGGFRLLRRYALSGQGAGIKASLST